MMGGRMQVTSKYIPSWELTYPIPKVLFESMMFLSPRWDILVPCGVPSRKLTCLLKRDDLKWTFHLPTINFRGFVSFQWSNTVDGRNPAPVEVGSFSHYLQGFIGLYKSQVVIAGFFHQQ